MGWDIGAAWASSIGAVIASALLTVVTIYLGGCVTDDDLECFGDIRDKAIRRIDDALQEGWRQVLSAGFNYQELTIEIDGGDGWSLFEQVIGDAISDAVALVRSGKDKEIIAELDARAAAEKEDAS